MPSALISSFERILIIFSGRILLLRSILQSMKGMQILVEEPTYIHAEFTSALFRFVDDVEFLFAEPEKVIHVRSASRAGYYDFGANRTRIGRIRHVLSDPGHDGELLARRPSVE